MKRRKVSYSIIAIAVLGLLAGLGAGLARPASPLLAARPAPEVAQRADVWQQTPTLVLQVYFHDLFERDRLARELNAEEMPTTRGYLTVFGDAAMRTMLLGRGLHVEVDEQATRQVNNPALFTKPGGEPGTFYGGYLSVEEMQTYLDQKVAQYPTLAAKVDIGDSWCKGHPGSCTQPNANNGYDLWVLHITNQAIPGPKPVFWYDTGIHSREIATPEMAYRYINSLLDGYNSNPDAHWLVDYHDIWVMPMFNPDGHHIVEAGGGGNSPYYQRKNANNTNGCTVYPPSPSTQFGTDLNRNFPFMWNCCGGSSGAPCDQVYHGTGPTSEPETAAVVAKIAQLIPDQRGPNMGDAAPLLTTGIYQNMHSVAELNLYPWGSTSSPAPNGADLGNIANHMSAPDAGGNGYQACQTPACLYVVDGGSFDWLYGELGAPGFTTELGGSGFLPAYSEVDGLWNDNRGVLYYMSKIARTPYLTTRGPDANVVATNPMTTTPGSPVQLTGTINYNWVANGYLQNVAAAEYYLDTPPWVGGTAVPMQAVDGVFDTATEAVQATIDTTSIPVGRHLIYVRGRGINSYEGNLSWGPISAAWLTISAGGPSPTPVPPTATSVPPSATPAPLTATPAPPTATPAPPSATPVPCSAQFNDVDPSNPFYTYITCLYCRGIISGYADGTFRPGNTVTRGQLVKMVVNAAGYGDPIPSGRQTFSDVPSSHPFWIYIEQAVLHGVISGYADGTFRASDTITRGQMIKVVANGAAFNDPIASNQQTFADVAPGSVWWVYAERLVLHGQIVSGYACAAGGLDPCTGLPVVCDGQNRPYLRPCGLSTRGQVSKVVSSAFFPSCAAAGR